MTTAQTTDTFKVPAQRKFFIAGEEVSENVYRRHDEALAGNTMTTETDTKRPCEGPASPQTSHIFDPADPNTWCPECAPEPEEASDG